MKTRNAGLAFALLVTLVTFAEPPTHVAGDVRPPVLTKRVNPVYPEDARKERIQGVVIIEAVISDEGRVTSTKVLKSLDTRLDKAADEAVAQWEFRPATLDGKPVTVYLNLTVLFRLE